MSRNSGVNSGILMVLWVREQWRWFYGLGNSGILMLYLVLEDLINTQQIVAFLCLYLVSEDLINHLQWRHSNVQVRKQWRIGYETVAYRVGNSGILMSIFSLKRSHKYISSGDIVMSIFSFRNSNVLQNRGILMSIFSFRRPYKYICSGGILMTMQGRHSDVYVRKQLHSHVYIQFQKTL